MTQDEIILADFGRTDSRFWRNRLAKTGYKPPEPEGVESTSLPPAAPPEGYYMGEDGKTYYSDGKALREANAP